MREGAIRPSPMAAKKPAAPKTLPRLSFRAFLEDPSFLGGSVGELSPAMLAIVDAADGYGATIQDEALCRALFACSPAQLPTVPRRTIAVGAGRGAGKTSRLLAPKAIHAAITVPVPDLGRGERARSVIVAPDRDLAMQTLDFVRGHVEESPILRQWIVHNSRGEIGKTYIRLRRPDGREVDITIGSATRGGKSVRGRTLVFLGLEEACFFQTDSGYEVTDKEIYRAAQPRLLQDAQTWIVSTPWIEGVGLLEERITTETAPDGTRRHDHTLVAARINTRLLNPRWDIDGSIEASERANDPENAAREIDAIPLAAGTSTFFDPVAVARAFEIDAWEGHDIGGGAGVDLGLSGDPSTLALVDKYKGDKYKAYGFREHRPKRGEPLKLSEVCADFAVGLTDNGFDDVGMDSHAREPAREYFDAKKIRIVSVDGDVKVPSYLACRKVLHDGRLRIVAGDGVPRDRIKAQLLSIVSKPLPGGGIQITAPRRRGGPAAIGVGHGDLVSALVIALWRAGAGKVARAPGQERVGHAAGSSRWTRVVGARGGPRGQRRSDVAASDA